MLTEERKNELRKEYRDALLEIDYRPPFDTMSDGLDVDAFSGFVGYGNDWGKDNLNEEEISYLTQLRIEVYDLKRVSQDDALKFTVEHSEHNKTDVYVIKEGEALKGDFYQYPFFGPSIITVNRGTHRGHQWHEVHVDDENFWEWIAKLATEGANALESKDK
ncbi:hypothetical protein ACKGJO_06840 [Gracilimonas sp. Q87]|uniref:hypothetical protein n=1 Tax=Gracilimonas sp. Q87 TaxID=3384766 RepID=UPI0039843D64